MQRILAWVGGVFLVFVALAVLLIGGARFLAVPFFEKEMFLTHTRARVTPSDFGVAYVQKACVSGDRRLDASWVDAGANTPAVIVFHGNNETVHDWAKVQADLSRQGISTFVFDYSGFGASTGKPTVRNLDQDAGAAYRCFIALAGVRPKFAMAHSLGTAVLLHNVKSFAPAPLAIATYGTFTSVRQLLVYLGEPSVVGVIVPNLWNNLEAARHLGKLPLLVVAGANDTNVTPEMGRQVAFAAPRGDYKMVWDAGHDDVRGPRASAVWAPIVEFFNARLGKTGGLGSMPNAGLEKHPGERSE